MKHKFMNKKTGAEAIVMAIYLDSDGAMQVDSYEAVEDLVGDYAAYEEYNPPKKPLIKDEKIRKAVQAWAEANDIERVWHECSSCWLRGNGLTIELENEIDELEQGNYSIAELCGGEEE